MSAGSQAARFDPTYRPVLINLCLFHLNPRDVAEIKRTERSTFTPCFIKIFMPIIVSSLCLCLYDSKRVRPPSMTVFGHYHHNANCLTFANYV